jgi:hypothetical protein
MRNRLDAPQRQLVAALLYLLTWEKVPLEAAREAIVSCVAVADREAVLAELDRARHNEYLDDPHSHGE